MAKKKKKIPAHVDVLAKSARSCGFKFSKYDTEGALHKVSNGKKEVLINRSATEKTSHLSYILADSKRFTTAILKHFGIAVPRQKQISNYEEAIGFYRKQRPVVVKPNRASLGRGVTVNITNQKQLKKAYRLAKKYGQRVLVEEFVPGDDYRVTVIDYKHVYVVKRIPAFVVGNGKADIELLIKRKNRIKEEYKKKIKMGTKSEKILQEQHLTFDSVPANGEIIYLRKAANIAEGGTSIDCTDLISKELKQLAIRASRILKLPAAGVDILTEDISSKKGVIIEINPRPHIVLHHYPHEGKPRFPGRDIIRMLFRT
ncbi:ATP-grasp domain-containing protein [Candidatus Kuenenbacteria bacterium]|nr:ATP-grasp domain-containing protein [Candidatus Kuenenbacteria bacterium]